MASLKKSQSSLRSKQTEPEETVFPASLALLENKWVFAFLAFASLGHTHSSI